MDIIKLLTALTATISTVKSIYNLTRIFSKRATNTGKDFEIYYIPILIINIYGSLAFWRLAINFRDDTPTPLAVKCYPSVIVFTHSIIGACYLQLAINWAEVAGQFLL